MVEAAAQGIGDELRCLEVHVSNPQRQQVTSAVALLKHLVLKVATARTVYYLIEIVPIKFYVC